MKKIFTLIFSIIIFIVAVLNLALLANLYITSIDANIHENVKNMQSLTLLISLIAFGVACVAAIAMFFVNLGSKVKFLSIFNITIFTLVISLILCAASAINYDKIIHPDFWNSKLSTLWLSIIWTIPMFGAGVLFIPASFGVAVSCRVNL